MLRSCSTAITLVLALFTIQFSYGQLIRPEADYYSIRKVKIPDDIYLEVGGLAFNDKGELGVTTRRGDLWLIQNPASQNPNFIRYAKGLHEPLGLNFKDGSFYCSQRGELTKLTDRDGDNRADVYKTVYSWDLIGNYHEYSYGPLFTPEGDMLVALNLGWIGRGASQSKWRGWVLKISEDGEMEPIATGMRSPAGMGFNKNGDLFYTENQGDWVGSGRMTHVEKGDFVGNPEGLRWTHLPESPIKVKFEDIDDSKGLSLYEYAKEIPAVKPPSVWFPHTLMGISTSGIAIFNDRFGPFEGQLMVGDQGHSKIMRVFQEQVNGVYQGACFPFVEGFSSGVLRLEWAPDGEALYVGMTSRGWRSTGPEVFALERLEWTGKTLFEMKTIEAQSDGFLITFTEPVDRVKASQPASYSITDFSYLYHATYGSPVVDKESRQIQHVEVSDDGLSARLTLDKLRPGYVYEVRLNDLASATGKDMIHSFAYYTLNEIPGGSEVAASAGGVSESGTGTAEAGSTKRINDMPASWGGKADEVITIGTLPGLKFDQSVLIVDAGAKVQLTFNNPDDMLHNLAIVNPNKADAIGTAAMNLGLDGEDLAYIPPSQDVLYHTGLLQPGSSETIFFEAPSTPGEYQFVCTFPGHHLVMRGVLQVK